MKSKKVEIPMCGSLDVVTRILPAPDLVGAMWDWGGAFGEALKYAKKPWNYLRKEMSLGRCCIAKRPDDRFTVITNRFTAVVDAADYHVCGVYPTIVKLVRRKDMCE